MAIPKIINAQRDFSAGEIDETAKRADEVPTLKTGARQMSNWRILSTKAIENRPGRSVQFTLSGAPAGRVEEFTMAGQTFFLGFSGGRLGVLTSTGNLLFLTSTLFAANGSTVPIPWSNSVGGIVWAQIQNAIYIAYPDGYPNNCPQVLSFDGVSTFTLSAYVEAVDGAQKRTIFYRLSPQNVTLLPSATTGNINITFSAGALVPSLVGTRLEYAGRQLTITGVSSSTTGTATVNEALPPGQVLTLSTPVGSFNIGDEVKGSISGATGIVTTAANSQQLFGIPNGNFNVGDNVTGGTSGASGTITQVVFYGQHTPYLIVNVPSGPLFVTSETVTDHNTGQTFTSFIRGTYTGTTMTVQVLPTETGNIILFTTTDLVVGPSGSSTISAVATTTPQAIAVWDDELMNSARGYPISVFYDQSRLGFTNFPQLPQGIAWSAIGVFNDLMVGALPDNAIFELAPDNSQVLYVIAGMESSEFVFTDRAIYYIPISPSFPLEPGSIAFNKLSDFGCLMNVQPRRAEQSIIYIKAGGMQVGAVQSPGAYYRPYVVDHVTEMHNHLFTASPPASIGIPSGPLPLQFGELYIYIALANGSLVVGHYAMRQGLIEPGPEGKPSIGWVPWNGSGMVAWVAARQTDVIFTSNYEGIGIVEKLDNTQYLDGALFVNNLPPGPTLTPPPGKGPLFYFPGPNSTVFLIDNGTRFMGTYNVDANGFIIPQNIGGENLASPNLVAGQSWLSILEIFMPGAQPGQSVQQRMLRRRISRMAVDVSLSSGFVMAKAYSGPLGPLLPTYGTTMNSRRIPAYNLGDDATQPAPLREEMQRWRPLGRNFDLRVGVVKDTPGPLLIHEIAIEVTV